MGWGPFGAPGWGYDMVSPPGFFRSRVLAARRAACSDSDAPRLRGRHIPAARVLVCFG